MIPIPFLLARYERSHFISAHNDYYSAPNDSDPMAISQGTASHFGQSRDLHPIFLWRESLLHHPAKSETICRTAPAKEDPVGALTNSCIVRIMALR